MTGEYGTGSEFFESVSVAITGQKHLTAQDIQFLQAKALVGDPQVEKGPYNPMPVLPTAEGFLVHLSEEWGEQDSTIGAEARGQGFSEIFIKQMSKAASSDYLYLLFAADTPGCPDCFVATSMYNISTAHISRSDNELLGQKSLEPQAGDTLPVSSYPWGFVVHLGDEWRAGTMPGKLRSQGFSEEIIRILQAVSRRQVGFVRFDSEGGCNPLYPSFDW